MRRRRVLLRIFRIAFAVWLAFALAQPPLARASVGPPLSRTDVQRLAHRIIAGNKDPDGWGKDIWDALTNNGIATRHGNVCAVMAVIEQESTFTANPRVKGLGAVAEREVLRVELPGGARVEIGGGRQVALAAALLRALGGEGVSC